MNTSAQWAIYYSDSVVEDDIPTLDSSIKKRIQKSIESKLTTDPMRFGKPLRHSLHHMRSLRVGDYRVLYHVDHKKQLVSIASIGHRRDVYDD